MIVEEQSAIRFNDAGTGQDNERALMDSLRGVGTETAAAIQPDLISQAIVVKVLAGLSFEDQLATVRRWYQ